MMNLIERHLVRTTRKEVAKLDASVGIIAELAADIAENPAALADIGGELARVIKELSATHSAIKQAILATGNDRVRGEKYTAVVTTSTRQSLDSTAIRRDMPADWIDAHSKETDVRAVSFKA